MCVRTSLSPLRGWITFHFYPRLAPWAAFLRRFAARVAGRVPLPIRESSSHALSAGAIQNKSGIAALKAAPPKIDGLIVFFRSLLMERGSAQLLGQVSCFL